MGFYLFFNLPIFYYLENKSIINNQYYIYVIVVPLFKINIFLKIIFISLSIIPENIKAKKFINRNRTDVFKLISETNLYF